MNEEKLRKIVQDMMNNNEPDDKIQEVVRRARAMMAKVVPEQEAIDNSIATDKLPVESTETGGINFEMAKQMSDNIARKNEPDEYESELDVAVVSDQNKNPQLNQATQLIEEADKSPVKAAAIAHEQDKYDRLSYVEKLDYSGLGVEESKKRNEEVLKPKSEELRHSLNNLNVDSDEFKNSLVEESVSFYNENVMFSTESEKALENENLFSSSEDIAKALNGKTPAAKMPVEMQSMMNKDADGKFTGWLSPHEQFEVASSWEKKPDWYPEEKWRTITQFKETGLAPDEIINSASDDLKSSKLGELKTNMVNKFFHANSDLSNTDRIKLTALMSDQIKGRLTQEDVRRLADNPELMALEVQKNNARSKVIVDEMAAIEEANKSFKDNKEMADLNKQAKEFQEQLEFMQQQGISSSSSPEKIKEYNSALEGYKAVQADFKRLGFNDKRQELVSRVESWNKERDALQEDAAELNDVALVMDLGVKNYSALDRAKLEMESFFLGGTYAAIGTTLGVVGEVIDNVNDEENANKLSSFLNNVEGASLDYVASLNNQRQTELAPMLKLKDVELGNVSSFVGHSLAQGAPSIATVLMTSFGGKLFGPSSKAIQAAEVAGNKALATTLRAQQLVASQKASKLAQGIFFTTSYGSKGAELNIAQRDAPDMILKIEEKLKGPLTVFERQELIEQKEDLSRVEDLSWYQKVGSQLLSGSIDMYSEKLGTLGYMKNLNKIAAPVNSGLFKKMMYQGLNASINVGTELVEETAAQIGNNISDIFILGEDKSMIDGIDSDFLVNTAITSLAIQGPSIGQNLYSMMGDQVRTKADAAASAADLKRVVDIESQLKNPVGINNEQRKILKKEKKAIMDRAAMNSIQDYEKLTALSMEEKTDLFDLQRQKKQKLKQLNELGGRGDAGSNSVKKQKQTLVSEFKALDVQAEKLLNKRKTNNKEKHKDSADPSLAAYNQGLYDFYGNIVGVQQELNGNKTLRVSSETTIEDLKEQGLDDKDAQALLNARSEGANATFVGDDIVLFTDNAQNNLSQSVNKNTALISAVSPLHELMHIQNRKSGIVKDGVVVEAAQQAIEEAEGQLKIKLETGKITQEQYNDFVKRKEQYTSSNEEIDFQESEGSITPEQAKDLRKNNGVDVEEVLNLFGDMTASGILSQYDFNKIYGLRFMLKGMVNKFAGKNTSFLYPLKDGNDVYSYVKSFQNSVVKSEAVMDPEEEELPNTVTGEGRNQKLSKGASEEVQKIYEEQGSDGAFDIIEQFKPITGKIVERRSQAPSFDRQLLTDEIETGPRGILDLIREYKPEIGVPLAAYINKYLPARAIEASQRILGEEFTDDVTEQVGLAATEESDSEVVDQPKRKIKLKTRLTGDIKESLDKVKSEINNLPIDQLDFKSLKNIALNEVQKLFGIKPKPGNLTKDDVRNAQQYINKNADALISMLPEGATPSGTSTGVQKVLLDKFYRKTDRVKMSKTGSKAGLAIYEKRNDITSADFKELFGITPAGQPNLSDRNTSARVKALVAQTERMLTNQEVRESLENKGKNIPQALVEGKNNLMYSAGLGIPITPKEQKNIDRTRKLFESGKKADETNWNKGVKEYGLKPILMGDLKGKQKAKSILFEGSEGKPPVIRKIPKSFITKNKGTFANGGMYQSVLENGVPIKLSIEEISKNKLKANETLKEYKLMNGKTILNTADNFNDKEIQLQIMPGGKNNSKNNFMFANAAQVNKAIEDAEFLAAEEGVEAFAPENVDIENSVKRTAYSKIKKGFTDLFVSEQKAKRKGLKDILNTLNELVVEDRKTNLPFVAALLSSISGGQGHFMRKGAIIDFLNTLGLRNVEEHSQPASDLGKYLFNRMAQGTFELSVDNALENFFQGALPLVFDTMLKGEGFNYTQAVDPKYREGVLNGTIPVWIRYFNPFVNKQVRTDKETGKTFVGIDPNVLMLPNGKSVAEQYGVGLPVELRTPSAIAKQQELLFEIFSNESMTEAIASQRLVEFTKVVPGLKKSKGVNINDLKTSGVLNVEEGMTSQDILNKAAGIDEALRLARKLDQPIKKIRVFDFDDTLATSNSLVFYTTQDGVQGELTAEQFAEQGADLVEQGAVMDFTDFDIVRDGARGPMFELAKKIKDARGNEDIFVLTARSPLSQDAIFEFLKSEGLEFKKENIVGLGNSTGEAKANWLVNKAAEGYNDFYFADDALQNVKAVQDAMSVLDVKSKVQQAKLKFSKGLDQEFDSIISAKKGAKFQGEISAAKAKVTGKNPFKFFIPYSAEDFTGLIYSTLSKGPLGNLQMAWYKKHLLDPYAVADENLRKDRLQVMNDFRKLKKDLKIPKDLNKQTSNGFTKEQAVRAYLYFKNGFKIPGVSESDLKEMNDLIESDPQLVTFANQLLDITKGDGWAQPKSDWLAGTISTDLQDILTEVKRPKYLEDWKQNADKIYNEANLNKLEALYGSKYREALEGMLKRMYSGKNRTGSGSRLSNRILDYINGSNAAIMFLNTRSAVLQTISAINFVNWSFNNPLKAGAAFANQPQYWSDFMTLMNSDYLKDRRNGLRINVTESEVADAAKTAKNKAKGALAYIMSKGYAPTQFADSFAIASGGATFYRNRINDLMKNSGMTEAQAKDQALLEWKEISEENQQSSRPDKISQQQASDYGRLILMFANTPMQYARIQKRSIQDLIAGRGDWKSNVSKVAYYGFVQNVIFNSLQQGLFALGFDGDDDDEDDAKKAYRTMNGMSDSMLRGLGIGGAAVSVVKNLLLDLYERSKRSRPEYVDSIWKLLQFSPPISSKISRLRAAAWQFDSKKRREEMYDKGLSLDNPAYLAGAKVISAATNVPLDRAMLKYDNVKGALEEETEWWQSVAMILGWPKWQLEQKQREAINNKRSPTTRRGGSRRKSKR
mgnify:CR=1 FL=1